MDKFKLFQQRSESEIPKLITSTADFSDIEHNVKSILNGHDRQSEYEEALESLKERGYYIIGWSSTMLTLEEGV